MTDDELKRLFDVMRQENAAAQEQTRRHFDALRTEIRTVADAVAALGEKVERGSVDIREEMRRGFAETQAMFRL
ncbi:MAG TPA: hypothetical protein VF701_04375 [Thermoanaerobaculia bacterium]